jgi:hypothetical protein
MLHVVTMHLLEQNCVIRVCTLICMSRIEVAHGGAVAQVSAPTPEEMDRDIRRITESVADFNMDKFDPDRKRREEMAAQLRDAAADFAKRAAERRAMMDQMGVGDSEVPPVALPTAPPVEVEGDLIDPNGLSMDRGDGAKTGDGSMAEEEEEEEIF